MAVWEQRKDEDNVSFGRFLTYRNLGPLRSLKKAYLAYRNRFANANPGIEPNQPSGQWRMDSMKHGWVKRAQAWDKHNLPRYGTRAAILYFRSLDKMAAKVYAKVPTAELGGDEMPDIIAALNMLGKQLTPDALRGDDEDAAADESDPGRRVETPAVE